MKMNLTQNLLDFIACSPTAWHAVREVQSRLKMQGFAELKETQKWEIQPGRGYYITRNGSAICAFITPGKVPTKVRLLASHTDSPSLKLKPCPEIRRHHMLLLGVEIYGAPLLSSWLNRDLGIAGRIFYYNDKNQLENRLVCITDSPVVIPQLAIHLDREVNEKGLLLNKQEHLNALATLSGDLQENQENYLETLLRRTVNYKKLLSSDLFLFPLEPAGFVGHNREMIAAYRLDNLGSLHASLHAFLSDTTPLEEDIKMIMSWDNEEIGSGTAQGAASPFVLQILERILYAYKLNREDYLQLLARSFCISIDAAHATHPNYPEKHDPNHLIYPGKGVVLKTNSQFRYATNAASSLFIQTVADENHLPLQKFASRNDIPCGTTIGPIHSTLSGMPTVDIGFGQLSMHACRELIATQDHLDLCRLLESTLSYSYPDF